MATTIGYLPPHQVVMAVLVACLVNFVPGNGFGVLRTTGGAGNEAIDIG